MNGGGSRGARRLAAAAVACLLAAAASAVASAAAAAPASAAPISDQRARGLYLLHCAGCHRIDGSGQPGFGVPSMRGVLGLFPRTPAGRAFLVQVPGARNAGVTDAELAALTNWALRAFSPAQLAPDFTPYTTAEVARWRASPPLDIEAARMAIVAGFPRYP